MKKLLWFGPFILLALLIGVFCFQYRLSQAYAVHTIQADFAALPTDDSLLKAWLLSQPGVRAVQLNREQKHLEIQFELTGRAALPPVERQFGPLGYTQPTNYHAHAESHW